jgi:transposase
MIEGWQDVREVKRAVSVKMGISGLTPAQICQCLQVSPQYVSTWKGISEAEGAAALGFGYRGSQSYLSAAQQEEIAEWIGGHEPLTGEAVRAYVEESYGVRYKSKRYCWRTG